MMARIIGLKVPNPGRRRNAKAVAAIAPVSASPGSVPIARCHMRDVAVSHRETHGSDDVVGMAWLLEESQAIVGCIDRSI